MTMKLLTPGPLTTTDTVRAEMQIDRCTWDDEYKAITQKIRTNLLDLAQVTEADYTTILMQGSGTFSVESVLQTAVAAGDKVLIITNGAYGKRIVELASYIGLDYIEYSVPFDAHPDLAELEDLLQEDPAITHLMMVHCETTTGILNPLEEVAALAKQHEKVFVVDAMSSFGGIDIDVGALDIDYLISSANKCIQGVPGFGFIIAKLDHFLTCQGNARSLSLDLFVQWEEMHIDGKWRYTSPTHVVAAFAKAIDELLAEGGIAARHKRYAHNNRLLRGKLAEIGIKAYVDIDKQSPIIATYLFPNDTFSFAEFYTYVKAKGFILYPGKLTEVDTFRIGNIGEIYEEDIETLCKVIAEYMGVSIA